VLNLALLTVSAAPAGASLDKTPDGPPGTWVRHFNEDFNGTTFKTSRWTTSWFDGVKMNNASTPSSNSTVSDGAAHLVLSNSSTGALIHTDGDSISGRWGLPVNGVVEARVWLSGNGSQLYNWSAFWGNSTINWPEADENDIAETFGGIATGSYHSSLVEARTWTASSYLGGAWHTYTLWRQFGSCRIYLDGVEVAHYLTSISADPEDIILNVGTGRGNPTQTGAAGEMRVDWVRGWETS
jgi:hypothetical protein